MQFEYISSCFKIVDVYLAQSNGATRGELMFLKSWGSGNSHSLMVSVGICSGQLLLVELQETFLESVYLYSSVKSSSGLF